jgi:hypothetical protein
MNKIKTFKGACKALGIDAALPDFSAMPEKHQKALLAHYQLVIIAESLNDGWEPNWNDWNEYKYYPWFDIKASDKVPSGFGFSDTGYDCADTYASVGSRFCYKSSEIAKYAGKQFKKLYKEYYLMLK